MDLTATLYLTPELCHNLIIIQSYTITMQKLEMKRLSGVNGGQPILVSEREVELLGQLKFALDTDNKELEKKVAKELKQETRGRI